jgi:hypothetical protein
MSIMIRMSLLATVLGLWTCDTASQSAAPATRDPLRVAAAIDRAIDRRLVEAKVPASAQAGDAAFLRRVALDLTGRIPTAGRVSAFLADRRPDRRRRLIDELLADDTYGRNFGTIWYHLLVVPTDDNSRAIHPSFKDWLAKQFNRNRAWDQVVTDVLTAQGSRDANPATVFWMAQVEGGKVARLKPAGALGVASQRFLGTRYQCAECHNHPFTGFKQTDFWSLAAFFGKTEVKGASRKAARRGAAPTVQDLPPGTGTLAIPDSKGKQVTPRFPDGTPLPAGTTSLRTAFARWATSAKNPAFARATVNRLWGHLIGRGLVDPVDDFREDSDPSHPDVLDMLAAEFVASGHDLKYLVRCICNSRAYQRSSDVLPANATDDRLCSHGAVKLMSTDVLVESLAIALGKPVAGDAGRRRKKAQDARAKFLKLFDTADERDFSTEYSHGIPQVLQLMNGIEIDKAPTLLRLQKAGSGAKVIEALYLTTLSRPPTAREMNKASAHVERAPTASKGHADLMWALINSSEFIFNH